MASTYGSVRQSKYESNRLVDSLVAPVVFDSPKVAMAGLDRLAGCFGGTFGNVLPGTTSREAYLLPVKFGKRASRDVFSAVPLRPRLVKAL